MKSIDVLCTIAMQISFINKIVLNKDIIINGDLFIV